MRVRAPGPQESRRAVRTPSAAGGRGTVGGGDGPSSTGVAWPLWSAAVAVVAGVLLVVVAASPVVRQAAVVVGVRVSGDRLPAGVWIATDAVRELSLGLVAVALAWWFTAQGYGGSGGARRSVGWAGAVIGIAGVLIGVYVFAAVLGGVFGSQPLGGDFSRAGSTWSVPFVLDVLLVIVAAPVCEELLFRGYVFASLCRWRGAWPAALMTGIGFGALHLPVYSPVQCAPLAVLGVGLCLLYWRTGSLVACMIAHSLNNAAAYAADAHLTVGQRSVLLIMGPLAVLAGMRLLARSRTIQALADAPAATGTELTAAASCAPLTV